LKNKDKVQDDEEAKDEARPHWYCVVEGKAWATLNMKDMEKLHEGVPG
jgi:hypothetical protein